MALNKKIIFLLLFFTSFQIQALDCRLVEKLSDAKLSQNNQFWNELGKISQESDEAVASLIKKHDPHFKFSKLETSQIKTFHIPKTFNISNKSAKALKLLNSNQQKNFEEFMNTVSGKNGIKGLYDKAGKWHLEKLKQYGGNSVRLDQGMRVLFKIENGAVEIMDIGKHIGH